MHRYYNEGPEERQFNIAHLRMRKAEKTISLGDAPICFNTGYSSRHTLQLLSSPTFRRAQNTSPLAFKRHVLNSICLPCNEGIDLRGRTVDRECLWSNGWHCRGRDLFHSTVGQRVQHKLNSIADS